MIPIGDLGRGHAVTVPLSEREGVYIHSFVCNGCNLHFNIYSWKADRHQASTVTCPECGHQGFRHWRAIVNESTEFTEERGREIYGHVPAPGAALMDDTTVPTPPNG